MAAGRHLENHFIVLTAIP